MLSAKKVIVVCCLISSLKLHPAHEKPAPLRDTIIYPPDPGRHPYILRVPPSHQLTPGVPAGACLHAAGYPKSTPIPPISTTSSTSNGADLSLASITAHSPEVATDCSCAQYLEQCDICTLTMIICCWQRLEWLGSCLYGCCNDGTHFISRILCCKCEDIP